MAGEGGTEEDPVEVGEVESSAPGQEVGEVVAKVEGENDESVRPGVEGSLGEIGAVP